VPANGDTVAHAPLRYRRPDGVDSPGDLVARNTRVVDALAAAQHCHIAATDTAGSHVEADFAGARVGSLSLGNLHIFAGTTDYRRSHGLSPLCLVGTIHVVAVAVE